VDRNVLRLFSFTGGAPKLNANRMPVLSYTVESRTFLCVRMRNNKTISSKVALILNLLALALGGIAAGNSFRFVLSNQYDVDDLLAM
jgi:hypothetical protein